MKCSFILQSCKTQLGLNLRKLVSCTALLAVIALVVAYVASPLLAAHQLRQAMRSGDTKTIERMVAWKSLRASVRRTVARNAKLLPVANWVGRSVRPTFWQRIRSVFGHSMLDRFVENYITPKGLPKLYQAKTRWHERFRRPKQPAVVQAGIVPDQALRVWRRIKRAEFKSPFRFILEIQDRHVATRIITSTFRLSHISWSGFDWKLTEISIRHFNPAKANLAKLNGF